MLSDADVREALLDSGLIIDATTAQNYRQVIATDIVDEDDTSGNARAIDLAAGQQPRPSRQPTRPLNEPPPQRCSTRSPTGHKAAKAALYPRCSPPAT